MPCDDRDYLLFSTFAWDGGQLVVLMILSERGGLCEEGRDISTIISGSADTP